MIITRNKSIVTGKRIEQLVKIKRFPVFIGATSKSKSTDIFLPFEIGICKDSGLIQVTKLPPPSIVYSGYHSEALGKVWLDHHKELIKWIAKFNPQDVLEIGGSNGVLATMYMKKKKVNSWIIVEPNPAVTDSKITIIKKLFDSEFEIDKKVDAIIHSHTLEHSYDPIAFLKKTNQILNISDRQIFSVPNLMAYLQSNQSNVLNFEHNIFLTEDFIDSFIKMTGFRIVNKKYYKNHSIFYCIEKINRPNHNYPGINQYKQYKKMWLNYHLGYKKMIQKLNVRIYQFDGEVFLFGAHVFSQYLLSLGLNSNIRGVLDNSDVKQNKRLYGTNLKIFSPSILKNKKKVAVILNVGQYQKEVKEQLRKINKEMEIWE